MTSTELKHQANLQRWSQAIQDCRASGLTVKAWCKTQGITATTYYRWERAVLSKMQTPTEKTRTVSLEVSIPRDRKGEFEPQILKKNQTSSAR